MGKSRSRQKCISMYVKYSDSPLLSLFDERYLVRIYFGIKQQCVNNIHCKLLVASPSEIACMFVEIVYLPEILKGEGKWLANI